MVEARNQLEALVHSTEAQIKENSEKLDPSVKTDVEGSIASARQALEVDNVEEITGATQTLAQAAMKIAQAVYGGSAQSSDDELKNTAYKKESNSSKEENVVDADFEEIKDDNKKSA